MASIRVLLNDEEIELTLERSTDPTLVQPKINYEIFEAKASEDVTARIIVYSLSGIVKSLSRSSGITVFEEDTRTTGEVILQRAQEALNEFLQEEDSGVQNLSEEGGVDTNKIKPYDPDEIKVRSDKFSIEYVINKLIARELLDLNPDFQRKFVWDRKRQSRLIESILLGIPIPFMYLSESVGGKFNVVDGLQRLSTFRDFLDNKFRLKDLEHLKQYEGCYFDEKAGKNKKKLDLTMQTRIETFQLYFNIIDKSSPDEVKYDIFERLNTGGLPLNAQEIRNCNAEVHVRKFLKNCADSQEFKSATTNSVTGKRMDDQELVLRYAGFYLEKKGLLEYSGNMKQFLNTVNEFLNKSAKPLVDALEDAFINSMKVSFHLFGEYAFRKCLPNDLLPSARKQTINKAMFVVWSVSCCDIDYKSLVAHTTSGFFAPILAENMVTRIILPDQTYTDDKSDYNKLLTTGTFDLKNIKETFSKTREILQQNNLL